MAAFPSFRKRRVPIRSDYTILENTDSETDSVRRRSISSQVTNQSSTSVLCDKCWLRHERNRASKRCLDCKQNLCTLCARCDETTRPWWLPRWFIQCWRFIFTKAYIPHSIVDLQLPEIQRPHWAHTQEANNVQRIPRVSRSSLRSNQSSVSKNSDKTVHSVQKLGSSPLTTQRQSKESLNASKTELADKRLGHSYSFDAKARRRQIDERRPRRTRSSDELFMRHRRDDFDRLRRYNQNWEDFENSFNEPSSRQRRYSNKMRGKDVNIEITDDKEIKLTINCSDDDTRDRLQRRSGKFAVPKCRSKKKSKDNKPQPCTEEIFQEVPIWFKKSSKHVSNEQPRNRKYSHDRTKQNSKQPKREYNVDERRNILEKPTQSKRDSFIDSEQNNRWSLHKHSNFDSDNLINRKNLNASKQDRNSVASETVHGKQNTAYIVEEPPDTCPICLEDLPGNEARALACGHVIHTKCLIAYLHKMDLDFGIRCPLCAQTTLIRNYYVQKEKWYMELPVSTAV